MNVPRNYSFRNPTKTEKEGRGAPSFGMCYRHASARFSECVSKRKKGVVVMIFYGSILPQLALVIPMSNMSTIPSLFMSAFEFQLGLVEVDP